MLGKRQAKSTADMSDPFKIWKEKPPGPEQRELQRMFDCKEINASATPDSVRKSTPMFQQFSGKVFAAHFRKLKAKYGMNAQVNVADCEPGSILELGFENASSSPTPTSNDNESLISFQNPPFFTWMYTDHQKKCDFVVVALPIISGIRDINFALSDDGLSVTVTYKWPVALYNTDELFKGVSKVHPKVHSFLSYMLDSGITEKSNPQGAVTINLPCRVKREIDSFSKNAVKSNDTKVILLEFAAYQNTKIISDADTSINFD